MNRLDQNPRITIVKKAQIEVLKKGLEESYANYNRVDVSLPKRLKKAASKTISQLGHLAACLKQGQYEELAILSEL